MVDQKLIKSERLQLLVRDIHKVPHTPNLEDFLSREFKKTLQSLLNKKEKEKVGKSPSKVPHKIWELHQYLKCILAVAAKDEKFIPFYFASSEAEFSEKLTSIIRKSFEF